ncbi:MAG TPA: TlpA disulfide reductase family protein [Thermoanaerobaculia bacterium]|nr:TlpA disulfide reductase family protein [Thermoanaerobaculia bacterium]
MRLAPVVVLLFVTSLSAADLPELRDAAAVKRVVSHSSTPLRALNLWATWCAPCVAEMPDLQKISEDFPRVELMGVSLDDALPGSRAENKQKVLRFLAERKISFRNYYFTGRTDEIAEGLRFDGELPVTFIFDAKGRELARFSGPIDRNQLAARLETLLQGR